MNTAFASLGKNLLLVGLLILSVYNFFYGSFGFKELLSIQAIAGLVYVFLSCYEYLNASYRAQIPVQRHAYFPYRFFAFGVLKTGLYVLFALSLFLAGGRVKYLYPVCVIIAVTELVIMGLRYKKRLCFISIYANYLFVSQSRLFKVFASEIQEAEFRHNILFFIKKDRSTFSIKLDEIENADLFLETLKGWLVRNAVPISTESKQKLGL
ncbi:MAG: hypothetical protein QM534_13670 [Sediminibacterium sp.]|nr:hypothetical protein [Sediminibacterium sp.]